MKMGDRSMENNINIEDIMTEIRQNIKDRGYDKEPLSFEEVEMSKPVLLSGGGYNAEELIHELEYMNHNWCNTFNVPISGGNPFSVFIRKVIRKCTRFIVFPIVNFQNAYNVSSIRCINQIKEYMAELETYKARVDQLEKELKDIKSKL